MISWKILIFTAALLAGSTNAFKKQRILNGKDVKIEDFPYQVSIRYFNQHFCGGSIISERHILTAAHCTIDGMVSPYFGFNIVTGTTHRFVGGNFHEIAKIDIHEGVECDDNRCIRDVAVITLKDKIVFDERQQKITLPENNYEVGHKANLTGWGYIVQLPKPIFPLSLQMIETELLSMEECQQKVINPANTEILETEICAFHSSGTGACQGDSGGPLVIDGKVIGIAAWVDGPYCAVGRPDVFTNVYKYLGFIKSVVHQTL